MRCTLQLLSWPMLCHRLTSLYFRVKSLQQDTWESFQHVKSVHANPTRVYGKPSIHRHDGFRPAHKAKLRLPCKVLWPLGGRRQLTRTQCRKDQTERKKSVDRRRRRRRRARHRHSGENVKAHFLLRSELSWIELADKRNLLS